MEGQSGERASEQGKQNKQSVPAADSRRQEAKGKA